MVKFAHIADCHLGSWRQEYLQNLNFRSFESIINQCIGARVDFILIAGDLFDSAYPPIEILKRSFELFKKISDHNIPVYLIAGSHDFSASGKTFLDVLEKAGFCTNVYNANVQADGTIQLLPTMHNDIAIYGYPGKKSGMEVEDLKRVTFTSQSQFTIFMLHTTIQDVVGSVPMEFVKKEKLPLADYYAFGHIHKRFIDQSGTATFSYPGPTFPCNFQELSDLKCGSYNMVDVQGSKIRVENILVPLQDVSLIQIKIENALTATQEIISQIDKHNLKEKIVLLKLHGVLTQGKTGDIRFSEIEEFVARKQASVCIRNIAGLTTQEHSAIDVFSQDENPQAIEKRVLQNYSKQNPTNFNKYLPQLMSILAMEKKEDEKANIFEDRLLSDLKETLEISNELS